MSGLQTLLPLIYHEKQQPGSQLCAQHALNAILQGDYFSAPDLAQFAQQLDDLEGSFSNDVGTGSNNMDDTGFFSVQVLEGALRVWGLTLVRWRSQDLRDHQERPHSQMGFILNHQQHWFTLRRFGSLEDPENGHWFNLNSFLDEPEWVGKLYLGMVLLQAENEGYSVFAVLPARETAVGRTTLPRTEADDIASTLPQPTSSHIGTRLSTSRVPALSGDVPPSSTPMAPPSGFEDEDLELQAALQASLTGAGMLDYATVAQGPSAARLSSSSPMTPPQPTEPPEAKTASSEDPVAASMARSKAIMQRMQMEQEVALREGYEEVAADFGVTNGPQSRGIGAIMRFNEARNAGEVEEEEAIRRAIEESNSAARPDSNAGEMMDVLDNDGEWHPPPRTSPSSRPARSEDRVYDDEDSELQAALKASLEGLPEGLVAPMQPKLSMPSASGTIPSPETIARETEALEEKPTVELDADELRRRRLARFGGQ